MPTYKETASQLENLLREFQEKFENGTDIGQSDLKNFLAMEL